MTYHNNNGGHQRELFSSVIKHRKYIDSSSCLGSRNHRYWWSYMYFIVMGGESVSTNKIGRSDPVALRNIYKYNMANHF